MFHFYFWSFLLFLCVFLEKEKWKEVYCTVQKHILFLLSLFIFFSLFPFEILSIALRRFFFSLCIWVNSLCVMVNFFSFFLHLFTLNKTQKPKKKKRKNEIQQKMNIFVVVQTRIRRNYSPIYMLITCCHRYINIIYFVFKTVRFINCVSIVAAQYIHL